MVLPLLFVAVFLAGVVLGGAAGLMVLVWLVLRGRWELFTSEAVGFHQGRERR